MKRILRIFPFLFLPVFLFAQNPGSDWKQYRTPEEAGWSTEKLSRAYTMFERSGAAAFLAVYRGHILVAWGDVERRYMCHSVRKSYLSALIGIHVGLGNISLDKTLAELHITDKSPLSDVEEKATVRMLLQSRSGVYHTAAYETGSMKRSRPERFAHRPGTFWYYNNWDFNVLGTIFRQETGLELFEEFKTRIATPLQMQDFEIWHGYYHFEPEHSNHPAYPFRMSARDMARFGLLYLRGGMWDGVQIIPHNWIRESTTPWSDAGDGRGYGYLWWTRRDSKNRRVYHASGAGGHLIVVIPEEDLVFVQRVDTYKDRAVPYPAALIESIIDAKNGEPKSDPELLLLRRVPRSWAAADLDSSAHWIEGEYPYFQSSMKVRWIEGRLFFSSNEMGTFQAFPLSGCRFILEDVEDIVVFDLTEDQSRRMTVHTSIEESVFYESILKHGLKTTIDQYRKHIADKTQSPLQESALNNIGYVLLAKGRAKDAIDVFELAVEAYPNSGNVYDSIGEAFFLQGDLEKAIINLKRSLEIQPGNEHAKQLLEMIRKRKGDGI